MGIHDYIPLNFNLDYELFCPSRTQTVIGQNKKNCLQKDLKEFLQFQSLKDTLYLEKNAYGYKLVSMCEAGAATGFQPESARIFFGTKLFQELGTNIQKRD